MSNSSESRVISRRMLHGIIIASAVIAVSFILVYALHREYDSHLPIDVGLFGTYGDFIGGVLGTFIALYSAYLLVRTLENQAATNESVIRTNKSTIEANNAAVNHQYNVG